MKQSKIIRWLSISTLLFSVFYFNIHWLIKDEETRTRFWITSTSFEFLLLGALMYQYSKTTRDNLVQAVSCLFLIYALGNYLDEIWFNALTLDINEICFGVCGILVVIARFYSKWVGFIINKLVPIIFVGIIVFLITHSRIFTASIIILISISYATWNLIYKKR